MNNEHFTHRHKQYFDTPKTLTAEKNSKKGVCGFNSFSPAFDEYNKSSVKVVKRRYIVEKIREAI